LEKNKSFHSKDKIEDTRNKISALLADGKKHHVTELHNFHIPSETLNKVLHDMMTEEEIFQEDGYLFSPNR
jgi:ATP-dependent DNA helicase RecQ